MKVFNNVTDIVRDDMIDTMKTGSKVSIAAAYFFYVCLQRTEEAAGRSGCKELTNFDLSLHHLHL